MAGIEGLTGNFYDTEDDFNKRMLLFYVNETKSKYTIDFSDYIDKEIGYGLKYHRKNWNKKYALAMGEYWKYLFYSGDFLSDADEDYAMECLNKAYKMGSGDAAAQLGYFYYTGQGVTTIPDKKKAAKFFKKAFKKKLFFGEYLYAKAISSDAGTTREMEEVAKYYEAAYDKKMVLAKIPLAYTYLKLGKNLEDAIKLFRSEGSYRYSEAIKTANLMLNSPNLRKR